MSKPIKVFISEARDYQETLREGLRWLNLDAMIQQAGGIFIKPNLTFPDFRPGVTTTKEVVKAAIKTFTELNPRVMIGEADGGYGSFDIEQTFQAFDLFNLGAQYGAQVVNLSRVPTTSCSIKTAKGTVNLELPRFLIEENFLTVTLPVPKVHCMTGISLSYKNQWGCIPDMMRLRYHYFFNEIIAPLNKLLKVGLSIVDGTYGLTKNGPIIEGETVQPGWLVMSHQLGAADRLTSHLMGLKLEDYTHYRQIHQLDPLPPLQDIETNQDIRPFAARTPKFYLKRNFWNCIAKTTWYSRKWGYVVYESKLTDMLHKIMYSIREKPKEFKCYSPSNNNTQKKHG
jgi:uncharacterized protein (DUF362 family)